MLIEYGRALVTDPVHDDERSASQKTLLKPGSPSVNGRTWAHRITQSIDLETYLILANMVKWRDKSTMTL